MDTQEFRYSPYSWHQSHDQATVLLMVPADAGEEDISVTIDRHNLIAGVRGQAPIVKGRLYGTVDPINSSWQLEPHISRPSRERTTSTASSIASNSTHSSYAFVSDPEISSSFAASLENGQISDVEDPASPSPALSSPSLSSSADELPGLHSSFPLPPHHHHPHNSHLLSRPHSNNASRPVSPGQAHALRSMPSSFSSLDSLSHSGYTGKLLTLHLEKEQSVIWPSLIIGPVPDTLAPNVRNSLVFDASHELEHRYNMDPTSLTLMALEMLDIRKDKEEAFEFFLRAWHLAHAPTATMKLVTYYLPIYASYNLPSHTTTNMNINNTQPPQSPAQPHSQSQPQVQLQPQVPRGTTAYYLQCLGGPHGLAQLYLEAGMLYLEGTASGLVASSHSSLTLSSIRMPLQPHLSDSVQGSVGGAGALGGSGTEAWRRDRIAASRFFDRARALQPDLETPSLPPLESQDRDVDLLEMPSLDLNALPSGVLGSGSNSNKDKSGLNKDGAGMGMGMETETMRRRRLQKELGLRLGDSRTDLAQEKGKGKEDMEVDSTWYMLIPGLVGAGTALVVVGVIGVMGLSWSRRNQGS